MNSERTLSLWIPKVNLMSLALALLLIAVNALAVSAQTRPRARDLGIPFPGQTGPANAITDVAGVEVGHVTLIEGDGKLIPGKGPIRTGVTAILTRPRGNWDPVFAATFNQNGNGDMTGINWIKESGFLEGPILLTGTHSVGTVRDAAIQWQIKNGRDFIFTYPIVAETFDFLNDANGQHVKPIHAFDALDRAKPGRVEEGAVGGGTGMGCNGFKGGIGTSSRVVTARKVATPSACWSNVTMAATCGSSEFRFVLRSLIFECARPLKDR